LEVPPVTAPKDMTALKTSAVNQRIDGALELTQESEELLTARRRAVLETLYLASSSATPLTEIQRLHTAMADVVDPAIETSSTFDIIAYNSDLRQRLIESETLAGSELEALANSRANAVLSFLLDDGSLSAQSIRLLESSETDLDEDGWLIMTFELSSNN
jgi:anionic cell wall polymer biosynthesis LytR-Cps2A-Psr (LCP) family protein